MAADIPDQVLRDALHAVTGEAALLVSDVDWDLKGPCDDCPFLRTSTSHQGVAKSMPAYIESIHGQRFAHTCHKTDCRQAVDGPKTFKGRPKHCAGALMMLLKTGDGFDLQLPLLESLEAGKWDCREMTERAKADDRVFTVQELIACYHDELAAQLAQSPSL